MEKKQRVRSTLPKPDARRRYQEVGALAALEQIRRDAAVIDERAIAVGPFGRLDADAVAARDGKTRGSINNMFGSQGAYRVATMEFVLDAAAWVETAAFPSPKDFAAVGDWVDAFFATQSARGPRHGAEPEISYASVWTLWLGAVPYGLFSERVAGPSMTEYDRWAVRIEAVFGEALRHFALSLREGMTLADLALATVSLTEGVWLNQCLTGTHPRRPDEPISMAIVRAGPAILRAGTHAGAARPRRPARRARPRARTCDRHPGRTLRGPAQPQPHHPWPRARMARADGRDRSVPRGTGAVRTA